jgi:hypothetical protein
MSASDSITINTLIEEGAVPEMVYRLKDAKIIIADYKSLRDDFVELNDFGLMSEAGINKCSKCVKCKRPCENLIDKWLIERTAVISAAQLQAAQKEEISSLPRVFEDMQIAVRPQQYGRALVVPTNLGSEWLSSTGIDVKGVGVAPNETPMPHSPSGHDKHGLDYLSVALGDFFYEKLFRFMLLGTGLGTVTTYAVLDPGFDLICGHLGRLAGGIHVRKAHSRNEGGLTIPSINSAEYRNSVIAEQHLRRFGATTAFPSYSFSLKENDDVLEVRLGSAKTEFADARTKLIGRKINSHIAGALVELVNIQWAQPVGDAPPRGRLVDFGHVGVRGKFTRPLGFPAKDGPFGIGGLLGLCDSNFVQPNPDCALDPDLFSRHAVTAWALYCTIGLRNNTLSRNDIRVLLLRALRRARSTLKVPKQSHTSGEC